MARANLESSITLDDTRFRSGLRGATQSGEKFAKDTVMNLAKSVAAFAGASLAVGTLVNKFHELRNEFDRIGKLSTKFNLPVETFQKLSLAADISGVGIEKLNAALTKATVAGVEAGRGMLTYQQAFSDLNVDIDRFNQSAPDQRIKMLAEAFRDAKDESTAFASAYRILGRGGAEMIPMFRDLAGAMNQAGDARFLSEEQVRRTEQMNDRMTVLSTTLKTDLMEAFLNLEPVISRLVGKTTEFANGLNMLTNPGKSHTVDDPTSRFYVKPGHGMEADMLLDALQRERIGVRNGGSDAGLKAVQTRWDALPEASRQMAERNDEAQDMRARGESDEAIRKYLDKMDPVIEQARKGTSPGGQSLIGTMQEVISGAMAAMKTRSRDLAGFSPAQAVSFSPMMNPGPALAGPSSSWEDLTRGGGQASPAASSMTRGFRRKASPFGDNWNFNDKDWSLGAKSSSRADDPVKKQLEGVERTNELLNEQNRLLKEAVTVTQ